MGFTLFDYINISIIRKDTISCGYQLYSGDLWFVVINYIVVRSDISP